MENIKLFTNEEDKLRQTLVFELTYILIRNLIKIFNEISSEKFDELPLEIRKMFVDQLVHINAYTEMVKPFVYEWPDKTEQEAYDAWIGSELRDLMLRKDINDVE